MGRILTPPLAFVIYLGLVGLLSGMGRIFAASGRDSRFKSSPYASGGAPPAQLAAPGYKSFFVIALFFALLHLGVLMFATGQLYPISSIYLIGLILSLGLLLTD